MYTSIADRPGTSVDNSQQYALDSLLSDWHRWASGYSGVQGYGQCAMFAGVKSGGRQWDAEGDVLDGALHDSQMRAFDHQVSELKDPIYRTALQIQARNLSTGCSVWTSARLPQDLAERAIILRNARNSLQKRLTDAGIL